jgi:hypothetical protein
MLVENGNVPLARVLLFTLGCNPQSGRTRSCKKNIDKFAATSLDFAEDQPRSYRIQSN